jgi:hypothetical protein
MRLWDWLPPWAAEEAKPFVWVAVGLAATVILFLSLTHGHFHPPQGIPPPHWDDVGV